MRMCCPSVCLSVCDYPEDNVSVSVNVNVEFKVTLHEQVRYRGTLQY